MGKSAAILCLAFILQGCYTRLYRGDDYAYAHADSLAYLAESAAAGDSAGGRDLIINRYYEPRYYRGYPYGEWDDPFFDPLLRPRLRGYWDYYYDPYWGSRRPYRHYRPYRPLYPPARPPGSRPPGSGQDSPGNQGGPDLYDPPSRVPPPSRGRRRTDTETLPQEKREAAPESRESPRGPSDGGSSNPPASGPSAGEEEKIPPPEKGRRR